MKLIGCPNCGGDDEAWLHKSADGRAYEQQCGKCQHTFRYTDQDIYHWKPPVRKVHKVLASPQELRQAVIEQHHKMRLRAVQAPVSKGKRIKCRCADCNRLTLNPIADLNAVCTYYCPDCAQVYLDRMQA